MARAVFLTEDATLPTAAAPVLTLDQIAAAFPELEVLEQIGRGGMGVVYKARQKSLNRLVALKLLAPERVDDPQFAARFEKEAQALAALNHPNIVTVHNFGHVTASSHQPSTIDNPLPLYFLLMEFVDGVNLRQAMSAGRFTPEQALAIVPPVCEALQYAHDHGIVHRDIKPENLLLDKDGRVKIADFGIAKILGAADSPVPGGEDQAGAAASQPVGTPRYMAPEQQTDPRRVDHRADIYSLGVVLYELLTGEAPGSKLTPPSQRVQIDVRLDEIVLRALNEKPEMRWQTAADLRTSVQAISGKPDAQEVTSAAHSPWGNLILPLVPSACCALGWWLEMMRIDELRRFEVGAPDWLNLAKFWLDGLFIVGGVALAWRLMLRDYDGKLSLTHFGRGLCLVTAVLGVFLALSWAVEAPLTRESMEAGAHQTGWRLNRWNAVWWRRWLWWAVATPFLVQPMWWIIYSVKAGWEQKRRKQTPPITTPSRNAPEKTEGRPNEAPFTDGGRTWWHKALTSIVIALLIAIPIREWVLQPFHQSAPAQQATATERMKESVEEKRRAAMASTPPLATGLREQLQAQLAERSVKLGSSHPDVMLLRQTLAEIAKRDDDAPAVSDAENTSERLLSAVVKPIEFSVGEQRFAPGDSITIESVEATSPALGRGDIVVVKGRFVLQSTNEAMLALYLGHIANGGRSKTLPEQTRMITKGSGVFELRCAINYDGRLHVRFYPKDRSGAFGEIWVGPAAQSSAAKPKSVSSTPVAIPRPAITQTASDKAGVIAQIQTAFDAVAKLGNMEQGRRYEVPVAGVLETSPGDDFLRRRTGREVFDSGLSCGCGDHALAFMHLMEPTGLELLMVDGAEISFRALEHHWSGHVVAAVKIPTDGTWLLVDPTQRKIIDEDWQRDAKTFYDNRFWIGYAGPISGYPAHTPDELREFLGKTLATVPPEVFARQMMKFRFKLDASMFDASGKCVNAYAEKMNELQDGLLRKHKITPAREVDVLLVKGGEDASGTMTYTEDRGWVATVGLRSACSSGYIDYMNQQVARKVNVR